MEKNDNLLKDEDTKIKKETNPLPEIGTRFMVNGINYMVCYVNKGQNRFSSEPCEGGY